MEREVLFSVDTGSAEGVPPAIITMANFSGHLRARHYAKCFTCLTSFKHQNCPGTEEEAATEKLSHLPKITQLLSRRAEIPDQIVKRRLLNI